MENVDIIIKSIQREYKYATKMNGPFNSAHEGISVIREEFEELWDEIKKKKSKRNPENMYKEAVQVATMAIRFINDVIPDNTYREI